MENIIEKIKMVQRIDTRIKVYEKEKLSFMTRGEMIYTRQKCDEGKPISNNELIRYSRAVAVETKIFDLKVEKNDILKEIKQEVNNLKEFYKKYIINGEE